MNKKELEIENESYHKSMNEFYNAMIEAEDKLNRINKIIWEGRRKK